MKRSEINSAIIMAKEVLVENSIHLPFFADMRPEDWKMQGISTGALLKMDWAGMLLILEAMTLMPSEQFYLH